MLEVWDLKDETRIQFIDIYFPLFDQALEFSQQPMELFLNKSESKFFFLLLLIKI
jgi:hypothetical protein